MKNTAETAKWEQRYQTALHRYLRQELPTSLKPALRLGKDAVALDLDTLCLARIHKKSLTALEPAENSAGVRKLRVDQAQHFFAEAVVPIEKTHCASIKAADHVQRVAKTLQKCKADSTASSRLLEQSVIKRQEAEAALDASGVNLMKLEKKSNHLHALLREKTHEILMTQEQERKKNNLLLQNEVAQALLAIDIRLLGLKNLAETNTRKFAKDLDDTQRMVRESLATIKGVNL